MNKVLEFSFRSIICFINGDKEKAADYKNIALSIYEEDEYKDNCICKIEDHVPKQLKRKLYEMVS